MFLYHVHIHRFRPKNGNAKKNFNSARTFFFPVHIHSNINLYITKKIRRKKWARGYHRRCCCCKFFLPKASEASFGITATRGQECPLLGAHGSLWIRYRFSLCVYIYIYMYRRYIDIYPIIKGEEEELQVLLRVPRGLDRSEKENNSYALEKKKLYS